MNISKTFQLWMCLVCVSAGAVCADVEIPVVVNVLNGMTFSQADAEKMVENMNKNLKPGGVKFTLKKVNQNVNVGNNDANLDMGERNEARKKGRQELKDTCEGKGMKVYIANQPNSADPNYVGWACHRDNVIFVKPDSDPNLTGATASHEATHALTVKDHSTDPNDLMYPTNDGTNNKLRPEDIEEIKKRAPKLGTVYTIKTTDSGSSGKTKDDGTQKNIRGIGRAFDDFEDAVATGGLFDPADPQFRYIDIEHVIVDCDDPTQPGVMVEIEIFPGGLFPDDFNVDSFFDVYFTPGPAMPAPATSVQIHIWRDNPGNPLLAEATLLNDVGIPIMPLLPLEIIRNEMLDWENPVAEMYNDVIQCQVPLDMIATRPEPLYDAITVEATARMLYDERLPGIEVLDEAGPFEFDIDSPAGPSLKVGPAATFFADSAHWVFGSGFTPGETVTVLMASEQDVAQFAPVQNIATADADGTFRLLMSPGVGGLLETYSVVAVGDIVTNNNIRSSLGYFSDDPLTSDLDDSGGVDLVDFAIFAGHWLQVQ